NRFQPVRKNEWKPASLYWSDALMWRALASAIASSRMTCQLLRRFSSSGKWATARYGVAGTRENAYINTLMGAMNVEWSVIWRRNLCRTRPRKCTYSAHTTRMARTIHLIMKATQAGHPAAAHFTPRWLYAACRVPRAPA